MPRNSANISLVIWFSIFRRFRNLWVFPLRMNFSARRSGWVLTSVFLWKREPTAWRCKVRRNGVSRQFYNGSHCKHREAAAVFRNEETPGCRVGKCCPKKWEGSLFEPHVETITVRSNENSAFGCWLHLIFTVRLLTHSRTRLVGTLGTAFKSEKSVFTCDRTWVYK